MLKLPRSYRRIPQLAGNAHCLLSARHLPHGEIRDLQSLKLCRQPLSWLGSRFTTERVENDVLVVDKTAVMAFERPLGVEHTHPCI